MNFDIDSKIKQNKERLKNDYNNLRNIQNSYGYIVVYLSFIGLTFFDFIDYLNTIDLCVINLWHFTFLLCLTVALSFIYLTLHHFIWLFIPRKVAHDKLPKFIYTNLYDDVASWAEKHKKNPEEEIKMAYLHLLEDAVENNYHLYIKKRYKLYKSIKFALISLIPYFLSMVIYTLLK